MPAFYLENSDNFLGMGNEIFLLFQLQCGALELRQVLEVLILCFPFVARKSLYWVA
jgi:hypothetical protein